MQHRPPLLLLIALGLLLPLSVSACSSSTSAASSTSAPSPSASVAASLTAPSLYAAFKSDKANATSLYKGKLLDVTGEVVSVGVDPVLNAPEVMLSAGPSAQGRGVDCDFASDAKSALAGLKKGETISVRGKCAGYAVNVLLLRCQLK